MSESPYIKGQPVSKIVSGVPAALENLRRQPAPAKEEPKRQPKLSHKELLLRRRIYKRSPFGGPNYH